MSSDGGSSVGSSGGPSDGGSVGGSSFGSLGGGSLLSSVSQAAAKPPNTIVMSLVMGGKLPRLNLISRVRIKVSEPAPAKQPNTAVSLLAAVIASDNWQATPSTWISAAWAVAAVSSAMSATSQRANLSETISSRQVSRSGEKKLFMAMCPVFAIRLPRTPV